MSQYTHMNLKLIASAIAIAIACTTVDTFAQSTTQPRAGSRAASRPARKALPIVGDRAPELGIEKLLQAPDGATTTWDALRGKVVVVEFWATWCRPCIAAFPHLNKLVEHFKTNDDIVFIAITNEQQPKVEALLAKKPLHTWIGLDLDQSAFRDYAVNGIPRTIIVDKSGKIAADTYPTMVSASMLESLVQGESIAVPTPPKRSSTTKPQREAPPMPGMPGSIDEMNQFQLTMTAPGKEQERLSSLAGNWRVDTTIAPPGPMGPKMTGQSTTTFKWLQDGRVLQATNVSSGTPAVTRLSYFGYDKDNAEYYICEISPMETAPVMWSGQWDDESSSFVFERPMAIKMMGAPGGDDGLEVQMKLTLALSDDDTFTRSIAVDFSALAAMMPAGMGAPTGEQVISTSVGQRAR